MLPNIFLLSHSCGSSRVQRSSMQGAPSLPSTHYKGCAHLLDLPALPQVKRGSKQTWHYFADLTSSLFSVFLSRKAFKWSRKGGEQESHSFFSLTSLPSSSPLPSWWFPRWNIPGFLRCAATVVSNSDKLSADSRLVNIQRQRFISTNGVNILEISVQTKCAFLPIEWQCG